MIEVISVRFRNGSKNYDFDPRGLQVRMGDDVIVETAQGIEFAVCTRGSHEIPESAVVKPLCRVLRLATDADRRTEEYHRRREKEAFDIAERKIAEHGLEMKLVNVSSGFEGNKIIFFFTADGRVDFRALVRDLASVFRSRIELRQIGVRDEARMVGGLGICGRPFCCAQFLDTFLPVSIKMAKTQNLSLNPAKISGACGRLMCCLKYEQYAYEDAARRLPKPESFVQTPDGPGNVKSVDLLRETVKVSLDSEPEPCKTYRVSEIILLRNGKGGREGIVLPPRPARHEEEKREEAFEPVFLEAYEWEGETVPPPSGRPRGGRGAAASENIAPGSGRNVQSFPGAVPNTRGGSGPSPFNIRGNSGAIQPSGNARGGNGFPFNRKGNGTAGSGTAGNRAAGNGTAGNRAAGNGTAGNRAAGSGTAGNRAAGSGTAGNRAAGSGTAGNGAAGRGTPPSGGRTMFPVPQSGVSPGRTPPPSPEDWADYENLAAMVVDEHDERHRNRNQSGRRGKLDQRGGKFQKQGREYQKRETAYEGSEQKRRGNRNYYRGGRRNRGGKSPG